MNSNSFRAGSIAAVIAWVCGIGAAVVAGGLNVQQTDLVATPEQVLSVVQQHTGALLRFMALDTIFVIGYSAVFTVIFLAIPKEDRLIGGIGMAAGLLAGLFDMIENALYVAYGIGALHGNTALQPSLPFHYYISGLKWMAAFTGVGLQLLVFPRQTALERAIVAVMCTFPLTGSVSIAWPALMPLRALFFVLGLPLLAVYFHQRASRSEEPV